MCVKGIGHKQEFKEISNLNRTFLRFVILGLEMLCFLQENI